MGESITTEVNPREYKITANSDEILTIGDPRLGPGGVESCVALAFVERQTEIRRALAHVFYNGMKAGIETKEIRALVNKMIAEFTPGKIKPSLVYVPCFYDAQNQWTNPAADFVRVLLQEKDISLRPENVENARTYDEPGVFKAPKGQTISTKLVALQQDQIRVFYKNRQGKLTNSQTPVILNHF